MFLSLSPLLICYGPALSIITDHLDLPLGRVDGAPYRWCPLDPGNNSWGTQSLKRNILKLHEYRKYFNWLVTTWDICIMTMIYVSLIPEDKCAAVKGVTHVCMYACACLCIHVCICMYVWEYLLMLHSFQKYQSCCKPLHFFKHFNINS